MNNINWIYTVDPTSDEPIMLINKHIGYDEIDGEGILGDIFEKEISLLDTMCKKSINIYINSPGGAVDDGFSIFNSIYRCLTPTCCYNSGLAASIAGVILQAGKMRKVYDYSITMVHNPARSGENITEEQDKILKIYKDSLITMLSRHNKLSVNTISEMMNKETWMDAETTVNKGFADEIISTKEIIEVDLMDTEIILNSWKKYEPILNKIVLNKNKNTKMITKLEQVISLAGDNAPEIEIVNAFKNAYPTFFTTTMETATVVKDETSFDPNMKNDDDEEVVNDSDMSEKRPTNDDDSDVIDYKAEYMKMKADLENSKIDNLISNATKLGKIKDEDSKIWKELAKNDYVNTEKILNTLGIKKASNDLSKMVDTHFNKVDVKNEINKIQGVKEPVIYNNTNSTYDNIDWVNDLFKKK